MQSWDRPVSVRGQLKVVLRPFSAWIHDFLVNGQQQRAVRWIEIKIVALWGAARIIETPG